MKFKKLFDAFWLTLIRNIDGNIGFRLRYNFYKNKVKYLGKNVLIDTGVYLYGLEFISIGDDTHIDKYCILVGCEKTVDLSNRAVKVQANDQIVVEIGNLLIGKSCHIAQFCMIFGYGGVKLGDQCVMSSGAKMYSLSSLPYNPLDRNMRTPIVPYDGISPSIIGKIELEDNVWIGINVCIFPGVKIARDSFVRTNSIVQKSFPENSYIAGDPAKLLKHRYGV